MDKSVPGTKNGYCSCYPADDTDAGIALCGTGQTCFDSSDQTGEANVVSTATCQDGCPSGYNLSFFPGIVSFS